MHGAQQHLWMHADSLQKCMRTRIYTHTYTYIHVHIHTRTCTHIYIYTYAYAYTYTYTWIHIHIHTHIYVNILIYIYIYIHMHIYMYISQYLSHMHILYRAWSKCVRWCSQHLCNVRICTCMVLNNTCECMPTLRKNAYGLVHVHLCKSATDSLSWKLLRTYLESCANIVQAVVYRPPSCRPRAGPPSPVRPPSCRPPAALLLAIHCKLASKIRPNPR